MAKRKLQLGKAETLENRIAPGSVRAWFWANVTNVQQNVWYGTHPEDPQWVAWYNAQMDRIQYWLER